MLLGFTNAATSNQVVRSQISHVAGWIECTCLLYLLCNCPNCTLRPMTSVRHSSLVALAPGCHHRTFSMTWYPGALLWQDSLCGTWESLCLSGGEILRSTDENLMRSCTYLPLEEVHHLCNGHSDRHTDTLHLVPSHSWPRKRRLTQQRLHIPIPNSQALAALGCNSGLIMAIICTSPKNAVMVEWGSSSLRWCSLYSL